MLPLPSAGFAGAIDSEGEASEGAVEAPSDVYPVTAPSDAPETSRAYFARTPHW